MKTILIDAERCIRCGNCTIACHDEHVDNDWLPIAASQGSSQSWIRIEEREVCSGARVKVERIPLLCVHCSNASCVQACPDQAIYRRDDGIVIIDPAKCKGCGNCQKSCAYDAIVLNPEAGLSQKCTLCAHLLDAGWEQPRCVTSCPTDALSFVECTSLNETNLIAPLELLYPERSDNSLVQYINLPKPFVCAEVIADNDGQPLRRVHVVTTHQVTGSQAGGYTDAFGDFTIAKLVPGFYSLSFDLDGFDVLTIANIDLRAPSNIGTIKLHRF